MRCSHAVGLGLMTGVVLAGASAAPTRAAAQAQTTSRSVWSGVYTAEQAAAGEKIYFDRCASCHGDDLAGRERAPALAGPQFLDAWHGRSLRRMLERIEEMPPGAPVSPADGVSVLAFLLLTSEMPGGTTALPSDRAQLSDITFERTKP